MRVAKPRVAAMPYRGGLSQACAQTQAAGDVWGLGKDTGSAYSAASLPSSGRPRIRAHWSRNTAAWRISALSRSTEK
jgi:hypothetical protein